MSRRTPWLTAGLALLIVIAVCARVRTGARAFSPAPPLSGEPTLMLWAWETPEDLRSLDPSHAGISYLSRELLLGPRLEVRPRRQPLLLPASIFAMPVVRIETTPDFSWRTADLSSIAEQIAAAADPNTRALQVDFDARLSERPFYAALLTELRRQLPPRITLSITALTSWCGDSSWLHILPIDEAVPMFFRMGGPAATRAIAPRSLAPIHEPLCTGSAGVATDELWPVLSPRQRVYLFRSGPWSPHEIAAINSGHFQHLQTITPTPLEGQHP